MIFTLFNLVSSRNLRFSPVLNEKGEIKVSFKSNLQNSVTSTGAVIANQLAYTLVGNVGIGTPPQYMAVLFDSGSDLFWIRNSDCQTTECDGKNKYDSAKSSSFERGNKSTSINYGDGTSVGCVLATDTVQIGSKTLENTPICLANSIITNTGSTDGIIGLATPGSSQTSPSGADIFDFLTKQSNTGQAVAGFWYDRSQTIDFSNNNVKAGEITFGGVDTTRFAPPIQYIPVISQQTNWFTKLDSISVNNQTIASSVTILLDTGTTSSMIPTSAYQQLNQIMNADRNGILDCAIVKNLPPITFTWGTALITLNWQQQVIIDLSKKVCSTIFTPSGNGPYILGAQFLKSFYSIFDYGNQTGNPRIGLALPSDSVAIDVPGSATGHSFIGLYILTVSLIF
ncbi:hypothetical protein HDV01_006596 [Terramyces sp. JEL0728]|nr:hypothetical protein HDV01_006596 [Terramyces sp. JEL0728]